MNELQVRSWIDEAGNTASLRIEVWVDGQSVVPFADWGLAVSLQDLERTQNDHGTFHIVTCTCGLPSCAGLKYGTEVTHEWGERVHWLMKDFDNVRYEFENVSYRRAIRRGIERIHYLHKEHPDAVISAATARYV